MARDHLTSPSAHRPDFCRALAGWAVLLHTEWACTPVRPRLLPTILLAAALTAGAWGEVVITEFSANNLNGLKDEAGANEDWIEVLNTGAVAVDLLGYYLTDDANQPRKWAFPSRSLAAGGYLVVFASNQDRKPASGNLHTNFKLDADGEYLGLTQDLAGGGVSVLQAYDPYPQQAVDVSYGTATSTPTVPLIAAAAPMKALIPSSDVLGATWRGAATDEPFNDAGWLSGTAAVGFDDGSTDIGLNVRAAMQNLNGSAYLRVPFTVGNPADFVSLRLTQRWDDGFVAYVNGSQLTAQNAPAVPTFDSVATAPHNGAITDTFSYPLPAGLLRAGLNVLAIHAMNATVADETFLVLPRLDGLGAPVTGAGYMLSPTPRALNSAIRTNIGPFVSAVTRNPDPRPTGTGASPPLTITARVTPSLLPLAAEDPVQLKYLVMFAPETSVTMMDNGVAPDALANDGIYSAQVPTSTLGAGQMLRWRVVAMDNTAVEGTAPAFTDPIDTEKYYGTVAVDSSIESNLPVLYWFTPNSSAGNTGSGTRNAFFFKAPGDTGVGRFYDNVEINLHGQSSSGFNKKSYDLDFNEDNRFQWSVSNKRVKDVNLMTNWGDKSKTHNQMTHEAMAAVGGVYHWCYQVRVQQVTPTNATTPANQFWSIADLMEDGDDDFMERNGRDPDGALYKVYDSLTGTGAEKKTRLYETSRADLQALITGLNPSTPLATRRLYAYDNLDLPQCVSYFVGLALASSQDHGHKNYYVYRDSNATREWSILPWDVDLSWGRNWLDASGYFTDTLFTNNELDMYNGSQQGKGENRLYSLLVGNSDASRQPAPEFRDMVLRRLRSVLDTYFSAPNLLEDRFAALADLMDPPLVATSDADRDRAKWGTWGNDGVGNTAGGAALRYHLNQIRTVYLPGRRTYLNDTAAIFGVKIPASQPSDAADGISIETIDFNPATGIQDHEFFVLRNTNAYSVDISGWQITGAVNWVVKPGTILPPGGGATQHLGDLYVARNPYLLRQRPTMPDDGLSGSGQYRFVQGPYSGQLSARGGEAIELRDPAGTLLKSKTWTAAPTPAQDHLRITELNYAPVGPNSSEAAALPGVVESDFEFIELSNTGTAPLALTGAHFDQGLIFAFPTFTLDPAARCLVVANLAAFNLRYPGVPALMIAGQFEGNLDNNGETIRLRDSTGENVLEFTYNNSWFPPSDEQGSSLVIRTVGPDWRAYDFPQSWGLSTRTGGTPGVADPDFATVYEGWRWEHFEAAEMPTASQPDRPAAPLLDPDGDLRTNFAEYAFGRLPKTSDGSAIASAAIVSDGGTDYLAVTYTRRHNAFDVLYTVETTSDPAADPWTPATTQLGPTIPLGGGVEQVTIRDSVVRALGPRFIRVRAEKL